MVPAIIIGALLTGIAGGVTAAMLGAAWWVVAFAFVGAGNLGTAVIVAISFMRGNERPGGPLGQPATAPALSRRIRS